MKLFALMLRPSEENARKFVCNQNRNIIKRHVMSGSPWAFETQRNAMLTISIFLLLFSLLLFHHASFFLYHNSQLNSTFAQTKNIN